MRNLLLASLLAFLITGCEDADIASRNLSKAADNFEIVRRVVFLNGITDTYLLSIEGKCAIRDARGQLEVTCKVAEGSYKKHFLGLSDNVSYFVEQMNPVKSSVNSYRVTFKPKAIIPDIDLRN